MRSPDVIYYACEQCGHSSNLLQTAQELRVFGQVYYFCSGKCRVYWLASRNRNFYKTESGRRL